MADLFGIDGDTVIPAVALAAGFPLALLVLNELINRCERRRVSITPTLRTVRNMVVPSLALLLFIRMVIGLPHEETWVRVVETVFFVCLLFAVLTFLNDVIFGAAEKGSWRERVPTLFRDLARVLLVGLGAAVIYSQVWDQEVTGALTALGIGSVVLGLALQEPLGNIVSGLMLLFERPLNIGDWITADGVTGKVIEINWRSVHIETPTRELRIVPNVSLYKDAFSNLSRPTPLRTETYEIGFSYDHPPNMVKEVLLEVLKTTPGVLADPAPGVRTVNYADFSVIYRMIFSVERQEDLAATRDRVITRIWNAARRAGLNIPFPIQMEYGPDESPSHPQPAASELLGAFPRYGNARAAVKKSENPSAPADETARILEFAAGEVVQAKNKRSPGFCLISRGNARLAAPDHTNQQVEIAVLGPGEFFGDHGPGSGQDGDFLVTALTDLLVIHLDSGQISEMLARSPALAAEVGEAMDTCRRAAQQLKMAGRKSGDSGLMPKLGS
ncbi:MAG: mechanosensitive ion channel domain-containing protein [Gemmataceae bacterium]